MNRYYIHDGSATFRFELVRLISGADARQIEQTWKTASYAVKNTILVIDLTRVTGMDDATIMLLKRWLGGGASLISRSPSGWLAAESVTGRPRPQTAETKLHHPFRKLMSSLRMLVTR